MHRRSRFLALVLAASLVPVAGCYNERPSSRRWVTTENTNVAIDWDRVNEAYRLANGPEDLERRVNEIYPGDEVISVSVADLDTRTQQVTGFFDRNHSGSVDEGERVFSIRRDLTGEGTAQVQTVGYGAYSWYHSPIVSIASGMLLGSMLSRAFTPGYMPMYTRPYVTSPVRITQIHQTRPAYRTRNPGAYSQPRGSGSGRVYGGGRPSFPRGGGRFGGRPGGGFRFGGRR